MKVSLSQHVNCFHHYANLIQATIMLQVHVYIAPVTYRKQYLKADAWVSGSYSLPVSSSVTFSKPWVTGCIADVSFRVRHSIIPYSLHFDLLCIS